MRKRKKCRKTSIFPVNLKKKEQCQPIWSRQKTLPKILFMAACILNIQFHLTNVC